MLLWCVRRPLSVIGHRTHIHPLPVRPLIEIHLNIESIRFTLLPVHLVHTRIPKQ